MYSTYMYCIICYVRVCCIALYAICFIYATIRRSQVRMGAQHLFGCRVNTPNAPQRRFRIYVKFNLLPALDIN